MSRTGQDKEGIPLKKKRISQNGYAAKSLNELMDMASDYQLQRNTKKYLKDSPNRIQHLNQTQIKPTVSMKTPVDTVKSPLQYLPVSSSLSQEEDISLFLSQNNRNMQLLNNSLSWSPENQSSDKRSKDLHGQNLSSSNVASCKEVNEFKLCKNSTIQCGKAPQDCQINEGYVFSQYLEVKKDMKVINKQQEKNHKNEIILNSLHSNDAHISIPIETLETTHLSLTDLISNYTNQIDELSTQILYENLNDSFSSSDSPIQQKSKELLQISSCSSNVELKQNSDQLSGFSEILKISQSSSIPCALAFHSEDTQLPSEELSLDQLNRQLESVRAKHKEQDNAVFAIEKNSVFLSQSKAIQDIFEDENQEQIFQCKFCSKSFFKSCSLGGHISRVHKGKSNQYKEKQKIREKRETERLRKTHFKQKGMMELNTCLKKQEKARKAGNEDDIKRQEEAGKEQIEIKIECEMEENSQISDQHEEKEETRKQAEDSGSQVVSKRNYSFLDNPPSDSGSNLMMTPVKNTKTPANQKKSQVPRRFSDFSNLKRTSF